MDNSSDKVTIQRQLDTGVALGKIVDHHKIPRTDGEKALVSSSILQTRQLSSSGGIIESCGGVLSSSSGGMVVLRAVLDTDMVEFDIKNSQSSGNPKEFKRGLDISAAELTDSIKAGSIHESVLVKQDYSVAPTVEKSESMAATIGKDTNHVQTITKSSGTSSTASKSIGRYSLRSKGGNSSSIQSGSTIGSTTPPQITNPRAGTTAVPGSVKKYNKKNLIIKR
jgi:hypothetical protein